MSWKHDLEELQRYRIAIAHHQTIMGYTQNATRAAIVEMRADDGPMSDVMHQRADECERALEAVIEFHNG